MFEFALVTYGVLLLLIGTALLYRIGLNYMFEAALTMQKKLLDEMNKEDDMDTDPYNEFWNRK